MGPTARAAALTLALGCAGCPAAPTTLRVHIDAASGINVTQLSIDIKLGTGKHLTKPLPASGAPHLPGAVLVVLPDEATSVDVTLDALDDKGETFTPGATTSSRPHAEVELSITIGGETGDGGSDGGVVNRDLAVPIDLAGADFAPRVLGTLSVVAGTPGGSGHADGVGTDTRLSGAEAMVISGNFLYFIEAGGGWMRKLDLTTLALSTISLTDFNGDPFTFNYPQGLAYDGAGTFYVASTNEGLICKVVVSGSTGMVTFLAGTRYTESSVDGIGLAAAFHDPQGLALDGLGNLFVADTHNATIRQIDLASANVTTIAGTPGMTGWVDMPGPAARFKEPYGLTMFQGELYVADGEPGAAGNTGIRKLTVASPSPVPVTTVVDTSLTPSLVDGPVATAGFGHASGLAFDSSNNLWVVDSNRNNVREVTGGNVTTIAGDPAGGYGTLDGNGHAARFIDPRYLALNGTDAWVSDDQEYVLRKIVMASPYPVTTPVGVALHYGSADAAGANAQFNQPAALVSDGGDHVFVTEWSNSTVRKVTLSTGVVETVAGGGNLPESTDGQGTNSTFGQPNGIVIDNSGNLWVTDSDSALLRKITLSGGVANVATVAGVKFMYDNVDGVGPAARFDTPEGLAFDGNHTLFVADNSQETIRSVDMNTLMVTTIAGVAGTSGMKNGPGLMAHFDSPMGLAYDPAMQTLYVTEQSCDIRAITFNPVTVSRLAGTQFGCGSDDGAFASATFRSLEHAAWDPAGGILWVADPNSSTVRRLDLAAQTVSTPIGTVNQAIIRPGPLPAAVNMPWGLAVAPAGLVISSFQENTILLAH